MKTIFLLVVTIALFSTSAFADVKPPITPYPTPANEMNGRIYVDLKSDVTVPTLKIRREALNQLRAAIDEADDSQYATAAASLTFNISRTQTIVSGTLFSLAFVFGGIWLFKGNHRLPKGAIAVVVVAVLGLGSVVVLANSPPPRTVNLTTRIFEKNTKTYGYATGNVKIQVIDRKPGVYTGHDRNDVILEIPNGGEAGDTE